MFLYKILVGHRHDRTECQLTRNRRLLNTPAFIANIILRIRNICEVPKWRMHARVNDRDSVVNMFQSVIKTLIHQPNRIKGKRRVIAKCPDAGREHKEFISAKIAAHAHPGQALLIHVLFTVLTKIEMLHAGESGHLNVAEKDIATFNKNIVFNQKEMIDISPAKIGKSAIFANTYAKVFLIQNIMAIQPCILGKMFAI